MNPPATSSRESFGRFVLGCQLSVGALLATVLMFAACSKSGPATFTPAIVTPLSADTVLADAMRWAAVDPDNRYVASVGESPSMVPFFTNKSLPLCVRYTGQPVPNGTVGILARDGLHVMHVIAAQTADSVLMSGYHNQTSDGWYPKAKLEGIVVGQLYLP